MGSLTPALSKERELQASRIIISRRGRKEREESSLSSSFSYNLWLSSSGWPARAKRLANSVDSKPALLEKLKFCEFCGFCVRLKHSSGGQHKRSVCANAFKFRIFALTI